MSNERLSRNYGAVKVIIKAPGKNNSKLANLERRLVNRKYHTKSFIAGITKCRLKNTKLAAGALNRAQKKSSL